MKRKWIGCMMAICILCGMTACGEEEVNVISKEDNVESEDTAAAAEEQTAQETTADSDTAEEQALAGYVFEAEGVNGTVSMTTDIDVAPILEQMGEPLSYFEAASCAFEGLDKMYTYSHFEIDTYPNGTQDIISSILLHDDLISTPEGLSIGMTKADMEEIYGTEYEVIDGLFTYTKDGMNLTILVTDDVIESISYDSAVLEENEN